MSIACGDFDLATLRDMQVHEVLEQFPPLKDEEFQKLKSRIRELGTNSEEIVVTKGNILLLGRDALGALLELAAEDVAVKPTVSVRDEAAAEETVGEFIIKRMIPEPRLGEQQRVAVVLDILPCIEREQEERQIGTRIKKGETRNPHGRAGKKKLAAGESTPPVSPEQKREKAREKRENSTPYRVSQLARVSERLVKHVIRAIRVGGDDAKKQLKLGTATFKDFLPPPASTAPKEPRATDTRAFRDKAFREFESLKQKRHADDHEAFMELGREYFGRSEGPCTHTKSAASVMTEIAAEGGRQDLMPVVGVQPFSDDTASFGGAA